MADESIDFGQVCAGCTRPLTERQIRRGALVCRPACEAAVQRYGPYRAPLRLAEVTAVSAAPDAVVESPGVWSQPV